MAALASALFWPFYGRPNPAATFFIGLFIGLVIGFLERIAATEHSLRAVWRRL